MKGDAGETGTAISGHDIPKAERSVKKGIRGYTGEFAKLGNPQNGGLVDICRKRLYGLSFIIIQQDYCPLISRNANVYLTPAFGADVEYAVSTAKPSCLVQIFHAAA